jgi:ABC-type sugar transport system permease subunit
MSQNSKANPASQKTRPGDHSSMHKKKFNFLPYLYILPTFAVLALVFVYPIYLNARFSLLKLTGFEGVYTGLRNYQILFSDEAFYQSLLHNVLLFAVVPVLVLLSITFSVLLFEQIRGWQVYRTIIFLPTILSITVIGITFSLVFQFNGALNESLRQIHLNFLAQDWLGKSGWALPSVMSVIIWRELGFGTILFLARLSSVSEDIFDAAKMDGAGWWSMLWYIYIPELNVVIEFYTVIMLISMLSSVFNYVYIITAGGPGLSTFVMELFIYREAFRHNRIGVASAAAVVLFLLTLILIYLSFSQRKRATQAYE